MNPFEFDFHIEGSPHADTIHRLILDQLRASIATLDPEQELCHGTSALLLAPRAGYGKTHLIQRLREEMQERLLVATILFSPELPVTWSRLCPELIRSFHRTPLNAEGQGRLLDRVARHFFGRLVIAGIEAGLVKSDHEGEQTGQDHVSAHYLSLFDPQGGKPSRAEWLEDNFEPLMELLTPELAEEFGLTKAATEAWGQSFYNYTFHAPAWADWFGSLDTDTEKDARERFEEFARIASKTAPLLFAVDHLDCFHGDLESARKIAHLLSQIPGAVPHSLTLLAVNQDLWESTFEAALPSAIQDRLTRNTYQLEPITEPQARDLVATRLQGATHGEAFVNVLELPDAPSQPLTPRQIIRLAQDQWSNWNANANPSIPSLGEPETLPSINGHHHPAHQEPTEVDHSLQPSEEVSPELEDSEKPLEALTLPEFYHHLRLGQLERPDSRPDVKRLHRLITTAGSHFPILHQRNLGLPEETSGAAYLWELPRREVYLGFQFQANPLFWEELTRFFEEYNESRKLVLISAQPDWNIPQTLALPPLDPLEMPPELTASLHAADELITQLELGILKADQRQLFGYLAQELDYFWKRLTRGTLPSLH